MDRDYTLFLCIRMYRCYLYNSALIISYMGWSLVSFIRFKGFIPDYLSRGWQTRNSIPFLYLYNNRRKLLECIGKKKEYR